jgi:hypothetical protein
MRILGFRRVAPPVRPRPRPWSSRRWCEHFHRQWHRLLTIPWRRGPELQASQYDLIAFSLAEFQQGEGHDGGHFFRCARAYAQASGDLEYAEAHRLFMAEEKRHARDLARFLKLAGMPLLTCRSWRNRLFCWLGSRGGVRLAIAIVAAIEVVGQVYYTALRRATSSAILRQICAQILRDEKQHVRFQAERLALLRSRYWAPRLALSRALDLMLFMGAALGLWWGHRQVMRAGGISGWRFWRQAWAKFHAFARQKDPRRYSMSAAEIDLQPCLGVAHAL